jgi:hypothetical protein
MPDAAITAHSVDESFQFNQRSQAMSLAENTKYVSPFLDPELTRKPEYMVYVYSVVDPRPDGYHLLRNAPPLVRNLRIAELKPGEQYALVTTLAHPVNQPDVDVNDQRVNHAHNAQRVAQDIVNPENISLNQDAAIAADRSFTEGNDFGKLGVFWSLNNPPTDEEVAKAIKRKEAFYRKRLDQARALEASSPKDLYAFLTPTDHVAADYFGEEFTWHKVSRKPESCPNCGEPVKSGVAFHASAALGGVLCIIDWKRAVEAGVKKLKDVPESKRWDKNEAFTGEMGE